MESQFLQKGILELKGFHVIKMTKVVNVSKKKEKGNGKKDIVVMYCHKAISASGISMIS